VIGLLLLGLGIAAAPAAPQPDVHELVRRSVAATERDWEAAPLLSFRERDQLAHGSKTFEVAMLDGTPYRRLVALNDEPLTAASVRQQRQLLEKADRIRRAESPAQRAQRIASYEEGRRRDHLLYQQMTAAFEFHLAGTDVLNGRPAYRLRTTPKPGYRPPNTQAQVLTGMEGSLWIDCQTMQWAKVEAHVVRPVSIDGFLARVQPGTRFELEYAPVAAGIWEPARFVMASHARVLFVYNRRERVSETYSDYQPSQPR